MQPVLQQEPAAYHRFCAMHLGCFTLVTAHPLAHVGNKQFSQHLLGESQVYQGWAEWMDGAMITTCGNNNIWNNRVFALLRNRVPTMSSEHCT